MKKTSNAIVSDEQSYPDLLAKLMAHTWVVLLYAIGCICVVYVLGIWVDGTALFIVAQVPTLAATAAVLKTHGRLRGRVPLVWIFTAVLVWSYVHSVPEKQNYTNELVALSLCLLLLYWLVRAVTGSGQETRIGVRQTSIASAVATLFSTWGATLQVAVLATLLIRSLLTPVLSTTTTGIYVMSALAAIRLTSPLAWLPVGFLLTGVGLLLHSALRFRDDPYSPKDFEDVLPGKFHPILTVFFSAVRLPTWICVVIFGFLVHLVKQLWLSFGSFLDYWLGRLLFILMAAVLPTILLIGGHYSVIRATSIIATYLSSGVERVSEGLLTLVAVHVLTLMALCLYIVSTIPLALEISHRRIRDVPAILGEFIVQEGFPAANAVGKAFSLYGILFLAVPVSAFLQRGSNIGIFSVTYLIMVAAAFVYYFVKAGRTEKSSADDNS